jgi:predicted cupin superfamily sugar epimerase
VIGESRPSVAEVVPAGIWQGMRLIGPAKPPLLARTVAPGFDHADYKSESRPHLTATWPVGGTDQGADAAGLTLTLSPERSAGYSVR